LASVDINGRCGYIDKAGGVVLQPQDNVGDCSVIHGHFNEGLSRWKIGEKYGFIDKSGTVVISPKFDLAEDFSDGMARIAINASWGFIDKNGDIVITAAFT
jgi:hypothetical protein